MMMKDLSMHVLDIAQNSVVAGAKRITICVETNTEKDRLRIAIEDDGRGMDAATQEKVLSPFYTSRTTRKIGLGIPMFKLGAELCGGSFLLRSQPGKGSFIQAIYQLSHIDRSPLGDMPQTIQTLIFCDPDLDYVYQYIYDGKQFVCDTDELREILGDVPLNEPEVSLWLLDYIQEGMKEVDGGVKL